MCLLCLYELACSYVFGTQVMTLVGQADLELGRPEEAVKEAFPEMEAHDAEVIVKQVACNLHEVKESTGVWWTVYERTCARALAFVCACVCACVCVNISKALVTFGRREGCDFCTHLHLHQHTYTPTQSIPHASTRPSALF